VRETTVAVDVSTFGDVGEGGNVVHCLRDIFS
jgi:hypothetical protein